MSHRQEEFQRLYEACHTKFLRYCTGLCYGTLDTRDLIQDSLLAAYENLDQLESKDKFLHYLIRTARNKAISTWRRSKFRAEWSDSFQETLAYPGVSPEQLVDVQLLYTAMNKLPAKQKEAVLLFEVSGFKINEIADLQNTSVGAVKTRLSRARKKLKHQLSDKHLESQTAILGAGGWTKTPLLEQLFQTAAKLPLPFGKLAARGWIHQAVSSATTSATGTGTSGMVLKTALGGWKLYVLALVTAVLYVQADSQQIPTEARVLSSAIDQANRDQWETTPDLWTLPDKAPVRTTSGPNLETDTLPPQQPMLTLSKFDSPPSPAEPSVGRNTESLRDLLPVLAKNLFGTKAAIASNALPERTEHQSEQLPNKVEGQTSDKYTINPGQVHYVLIVFNGPVNLFEAKMAVSNYNQTYHKVDKLQISSLFMGPTPQDRLPMIIVRRFENMGESMKYYQSFMQQASDIMTEGKDYQVFTASLDNYRTMLRQKSLDGYPAFFEANYINEGQKR